MPDQFVASLLEHCVLPDPYWKENDNYITPCYENLIGAAYSLHKAEENGFRTANYEHYKVEGLYAHLSRICSGQGVINGNWRLWISGFYFNAGLQRIVWACDRLLTLFYWLPCQEGASQQPEKPKNIYDIKKRASSRLKVLEKVTRYRPLDGIKKSLKCIRPVVFDKDPVSDDNFLAVIRARVNMQKHAARGFTYVEGGKVDKGPWPHLKPAKQFEWGLRAFEVVSNIYQDVHYLYFKERALYAPTWPK